EQSIRFPDRRLRTVNYDLEAAYAGIYDAVVSGVESLTLAPYNLEAYKKAGVEVDEFEAGREQALVGIFKSRYLKRFESSIEAFRISIRRALAFLKTFESYILDGRILKSGDFHRALRYLDGEDEEDATPTSMAEEMDDSEEARRILDAMERIDPATYDLRRLHDAVQHDVDVLSEIWQRVKDISSEDDAKLDASVLGETVHPRNFNTLRRIRDEDGSVIEEEEQFIELASNEFLVHQLRALLDAGGREMLESLPDGIHSGLAKAGAQGVFFYFQARAPEGGKLHFWKYFDLHDQRIIDNRYIVANLIACNRDTPRVVDPEMFRSVFDLQEKVIEDILRSFEEQKALEMAPRSVDPIQQTVTTVLQGYMNHPDIERRRAIEVIRFLNQPMLGVQVRELREAYRNFQRKADIKALLSAVEELRKKFGAQQANSHGAGANPIGRLSREDLRLICFDLVTGG
ncbi:MAG: hypothetical protein HYZ81_00880, partial [Nitrospinae bacterium]|nr:hypothetical protein [Nitrospinota bacterium]